MHNSLIFEPVSIKFESSANKMKNNFSETLCKSLIKIKKRSGPKIDPWGTPHDILNS